VNEAAAIANWLELWAAKGNLRRELLALPKPAIGQGDPDRMSCACEQRFGALQHCQCQLFENQRDGGDLELIVEPHANGGH